MNETNTFFALFEHTAFFQYYRKNKIRKEMTIEEEKYFPVLAGLVVEIEWSAAENWHIVSVISSSSRYTHTHRAVSVEIILHCSHFNTPRPS